MGELELGNLNVIIKNADGTTADHALTIREEADVQELKQAIMETYPGQPREDRMKIVFSGRLLRDAEVLFDLVQTHDPMTAPVFHLLLRPADGGEKSVTPSPSPKPAVAAAPRAVAEPATPPTPQPSPAPLSRSGSSLREVPASPALAAASAAIERIAQQQQQQQQQQQRAAPHDSASLRACREVSPAPLTPKAPKSEGVSHHATAWTPRAPGSDGSPTQPSLLPRAPNSHGSAGLSVPSTPQAPSASPPAPPENTPQDPAAALVGRGLPHVALPGVAGISLPGLSPLGGGGGFGLGAGAVGFGAVGGGLPFGVDAAALQEQLRKIYYEAYYRAYLQHFTEAIQEEEGEEEEEVGGEGAGDRRSSQGGSTAVGSQGGGHDGRGEGGDDACADGEHGGGGEASPEGREGGAAGHGQEAPLLPGARVRIDEQAELHARHEDLAAAGGRTLQLALKLVFVVFLLGQDAPRERLYIICFLALCIFLHQTGCLRVFSWLYLPRLNVEDQFGELDEDGGDREGEGEGGGEGFVGLLSDVTALVVGFFTSLVPRTPAGVFAN